MGEEGNWEIRSYLRGVMEMFWKWIVEMVAQNYECTKATQGAKEALLPL